MTNAATVARFAATAAVWAAAVSAAVAAGPAGDGRTALKVCQDPNNLPFSNSRGEGLENRIAELFGKAMNLPVTYYEFPQRMAFIRNTLRYKLPGQDYACDLVVGVPVGFDEGVAVTTPYYRSTYALVLPEFAGVTTAAQFLALDPARLGALRIGVYDRSPASAWLQRHGLTDSAVVYPIRNADPAHYAGRIIDQDLAQGKLDAAIVWGPIAGYFAQRVDAPRLTVVPLPSEPGLKLDYEMAMAVRPGDAAFKQQVEQLIGSQRAGIDAILRQYGVPRVEAPAEASAKP